MSHLERVLEVLPLPYAVAPDSVIARILDAVTLEMEAFDEDLMRLQRSHWIGFAERLEDAAKLGALVGIQPLPWETLATFRARLLPLVAARLAGSLGVAEIRRFVFDYLSRCEAAETLDSLFVPPGLGRLGRDAAFGAASGRPHYRPLELVENPPRRRASGELVARGGQVPYLLRWREDNRGLDETFATFRIAGLPGDRTAVPILLNRTSGELLGYRGVLGFGQVLELTLAAEAGGDRPRLAAADLDGRDASDRLFGGSGISLAAGWEPSKLEPRPQLPRLLRGANDWIFLSAGLFDVKGLDRVFFALAGEELAEGTFDETRFDHALFPSGAVAQLAMEWLETEPAAFEVRVPRYLVVEPSDLAAAAPRRPWQMVADGLTDSLAQLHAAGVSASVRFEPFVETQQQKARVDLPWVRLDPEASTAGRDAGLDLGGHFGESSFGSSRFE